MGGELGQEHGFARPTLLLNEKNGLAHWWSPENRITDMLRCSIYLPA
jgi:hypothetical protein